MDKKVSIIAEIGVNHNGSMKMAKKLVKKLSKLDIDYIKFQMAMNFFTISIYKFLNRMYIINRIYCTYIIF